MRRGHYNPQENCAGHATKLTQEVVVLLLNQLPKWSPQNTNVFLCGPEGMIGTVENALASQNVPPTIIVKERFVSTASADFIAMDRKMFGLDR